MPMTTGNEISTIFLVLRRVRGTLIGLILIYAIAVLGLTLVPGPPGPDGEPLRLSFFHAFYFISYTATTIGFGEIPYAFSEQQRLWVMFCIYLSVIGWAVFIGKLLQMAQDANLQRAIRSSRFGREVRKLHEPFYIVCGYGETGHLICAALDRMGYRVVVLEINDERLADIELQSYSADMPHLVTDAANPKMLRLSGLAQRHCKGLIALTDHDATNLAIAITGCLLSPQLPVLARAEEAETAANMASFGTHHIINPFNKFTGYLALALHTPSAYQLLVWLTGLPGAPVAQHRPPPRGHWILLGFGRLARQLADSLAQEGMPVTVLALEEAPDTLAPGVRWLVGDGTCAPALLQAGLTDAVGLIAATANDINNLSAAVTTRQLNPNAFLIVRQNNVMHQPLFASLDADITMVPSAVIAHECLAILTTPLLAPFLQVVKVASADWSAALLERLTQRLGWQTPEVWSVRLSVSEAPALHVALTREQVVRLGDVLRDPGAREKTLVCEVLQLVRDDQSVLLPGLDTTLQAGDQLLLVGQRSSRSQLALTLGYQHTLQYVLTGRNQPGGWVWEKLTRQHSSV